MLLVELALFMKKYILVKIAMKHDLRENRNETIPMPCVRMQHRL